MAGQASCPRCDAPVTVARAVCSRCGFAVLEERIAGRGRRIASGRRYRRHARRVARLPAAAALIVAAGAGLAVLAAPAAREPSSDALAAAQAELRLAARYPHLGHADHAVIACPERAIQPGGEARCWVLARVGLQRSVTVRLSRSGNRVEIED